MEYKKNLYSTVALQIYKLFMAYQKNENVFSQNKLKKDDFCYI